MVFKPIFLYFYFTSFPPCTSSPSPSPPPPPSSAWGRFLSWLPAIFFLFQIFTLRPSFVPEKGKRSHGLFFSEMSRALFRCRNFFLLITQEDLLCHGLSLINLIEKKRKRSSKILSGEPHMLASQNFFWQNGQLLVRYFSQLCQKISSKITQ